MFKYKAAGEKRTQREMQIQSLRSAVDKTKQLMQLSSANYLEVLTAQQSLLNAELSGVKDSFDQIQSVVSLYQALGGGRGESNFK